MAQRLEHQLESSFVSLISESNGTAARLSILVEGLMGCGVSYNPATDRPFLKFQRQILNNVSMRPMEHLNGRKSWSMEDLVVLGRPLRGPIHPRQAQLPKHCYRPNQEGALVSGRMAMEDVTTIDLA